jgi:hypothetical protein
MPLDKESFKEIDVYDKKKFATDASIQGALIALGVYVADIDPHDCRDDVRRLVDMARELPEFAEISEDEASTEKRIHYYIEALQNSDQSADIIDRAVRRVPPDAAQRAVDWLARVCEAAGATEAGVKKRDHILAKLRK